MKNSTTAVVLLFTWLAVTMALWWFALLPVGESTPAWVAKAQAACFGTTMSGLPDAGGWIMITLAPLSLITAIVIGLYSETIAGLHRLWKQPAGKALCLACSLLVVVQCSWASKRVRTGVALEQAVYAPIETSDLPQNYPKTSEPVAAFNLIDQSGQQVSLPSSDAKAKILTFAFAHCQTVCPALVASSLAALKELPEDKVELLIITLDPWRDTPAALPTLATQWKLPRNARVLSGDVDTVNKVISEYKIPTERNEKNGDVTHPAIIYIVSPENTITYTFNNPPVKWISSAIYESLSTDPASSPANT